MHEWFNSRDPFRIGLEWEATSQVNTPIDFGQELATRIVPETSTIIKNVDFFANFPNVQSAGFSNIVLATVYEDGADQTQQQVFTERLPVTGGSQSPENSYFGGAASLSDALATPRDGRGVNIAAYTGSAFYWIRPTFALATFPGVVKPRILDVTVEMRLSGTSVPATGVVGVAWYYPSAGSSTNFGVMENFPAFTDGDLQAIAHTGETRNAPGNVPVPWMPADITALNSGAITFYLTNIIPALFGVEYCAVTVTYCEENRLAVGAARFNSPQLPSWVRVPMYNTASGTLGGAAIGQHTPYLLTLTRATDADCSFQSRSNPVATHYQAGPGVPLAGLRPMTGAGFETFTLPRYSDGRIAGSATPTDVGYAVMGRDGSDGVIAGAAQPYYKVSPSTSGVTTQTISTLQPGLYSHVSAVVKPQGNPGALTLSIGSSSATLTVDEFSAYPTTPDGYALVTLPLSVPATVMATGAAFVTATTLTGTNRWLIPILSAGPWHALHDAATYSGTVGRANSTNSWDAPITLSLSAPAVTGLIVTGGVMNLDAIDTSCSAPQFTELDYASICWGNIPTYTTSFDAGPLPTFVNIGAQMAVANVTGSPAMPASLVTGDFLLLSVETNQTHAPAFVTESGGTWTFLHEQQASTFTRLTQYTSIYNGTQTAPIIAATGDHAIARIIAYRGVNTAAPIDAWDNNAITITGSPGPGAFPIVTTTGPNRRIVYTAGSGADVATAFLADETNITLTSITERFDAGGTQGSGGGLALWDGGLAAAGASGTATATFTSAQLNLAVSTIALAPALLVAPTVTGAPVTGGFCAWEVERRDAVDDTWRQIARLTDQNARCVFDFEARIGVSSDYRVRMCRIDGTCGDWSSTVSWTRAGPLALSTTRKCDSLVFTSNEDPFLTVVYPYAFEGDVEEAFTFVEAETVTLQRLHMRDYQVAFKPLERGGVRFQRTMLVNSISVPSERLDRKFLALRDIAWATLSYVAVLDTRGNRWFAAVIVPDGTVRNPPHIYMASVDIVEVTNRPSIVDVRAS